MHNAEKEDIDNALQAILSDFGDIDEGNRTDGKDKAVIFVYYSGHGGVDEDKDTQ